MIQDLITKNRSCRRFLQKEPVPVDTLRWLVNLARLSASSANLQPLKYRACQKFFPLLRLPQEPKSPLPPLFQRGELSGITLKVPLCQRGI